MLLPSSGRHCHYDPSVIVTLKRKVSRVKMDKIAAEWNEGMAETKHRILETDNLDLLLSLQGYL